jgi:hypothetical protein
VPTWICNIPGADPVTIAWHATLHLGLAAIVLGAGAIFLLLAVRAYRQPDQPASAFGSGTRRSDR